MRKLCVADGRIAICLLSQSSKRRVSLSPSIQMYAFTSSNVLLFQSMPPRHSWRTSEFPTPVAGEGLSFFCQTANSSSILFRIWTYLLSNLSLLDSYCLHFEIPSKLPDFKAFRMTELFWAATTNTTILAIPPKKAVLLHEAQRGSSISSGWIGPQRFAKPQWVASLKTLPPKHL